ncbi:MAG: hypothetical protein Q8K45_19395 [Rubrivivax sp.]|nr:hypothetical protein [Rubrivivax sp.]
MSQNEPKSILSALVAPRDYQAQRQNLFPSPTSLEWYARQNRDRLIDAGALLMHSGRWYVHAEKFDACVFAVGAERAKRQLVA